MNQTLLFLTDDEYEEWPNNEILTFEDRYARRFLGEASGCDYSQMLWVDHTGNVTWIGKDDEDSKFHLGPKLNNVEFEARIEYLKYWAYTEILYEIGRIYEEIDASAPKFDAEGVVSQGIKKMREYLTEGLPETVQQLYMPKARNKLDDRGTAARYRLTSLYEAYVSSTDHVQPFSTEYLPPAYGYPAFNISGDGKHQGILVIRVHM